MPSPPNPRRHALRAAILILAAAVAVIMFFPRLNTSPKPTRLLIHRGTPFTNIVKDLQKNGAVTSRWPLMAIGQFVPSLHNIKPGRYLIPPGLSNIGLLQYLHRHDQDEVRVTIPEGLDISTTASVISRHLDIDSTSFTVEATQRKLEGRLFPGTYNFPWASTPREVQDFLSRQFDSFFTDSLKSMAARKGLNENELLTLASIVEAETPLDSEKPLVASVYLNRLKKNMPLQADPTVQYALPGPRRKLYYKDLRVDSSYNTYLHRGLPPGPICSPGAKAILAVLNPATTSYLYFVATGTGGHYFASTLSGHNRNTIQYRTNRNRQ
ncbi:MAG: endolytic transglycosylase MltG [Candidatus Chlorobium antarcticum]|nr:endolytic transglycosylase MltG [Candidatus Chlorobium antarcticum]